MTLSFDRWIGQIAVVTGASSGIGAAVSEFLVDKGLIVVGLARRVELVQEKAHQLSNKPGKLIPAKVDVRKEEDLVKVFNWIEKNFGNVYILINNAGVTVQDNLWNGDAEKWKTVLDVNVFGLCVATREVVKRMVKNNIDGHIIHVNSISGHRVLNLPEINVYAGSKHAVTALTETLRREILELRCKIKVTSLSPGLVTSEMTTLNPAFSDERLQVLHAMPILKAEDIAEAIGYILSTPEHVQINEMIITPLGERL